jgi:hypothetical protein
MSSHNSNPDLLIPVSVVLSKLESLKKDIETSITGYELGGVRGYLKICIRRTEDEIRQEAITDG